MSMTVQNATHDAVREWARGMYATEAGAELLIREGLVSETRPWIKRLSDTRSAIDGEILAQEMGVWSGGEQRIVRIALSLLGYDPVDLSEELAGLDRDELSLVLAAIAHAGGSHEHSEWVVSDGKFSGSRKLDSLYAWPE